MPKKTFEKADEAGAIFITQAKDNQKKLRRQLAHGCSVKQPLTTHEDIIEKHHGRLEKRKYEVFDTKDILRKWPEWKAIKCVVRVSRSRAATYNPDEKTEGVFYYASNRILPAPEMGKYIRDHWLVENKLHHVRDRAFLEDETVKRKNPFIFSTLISFAINILRVNRAENIKSSLFLNSMQLDNLIKSINHL